MIEQSVMPSILLHAREAGVATLFAELIPVFQNENWQICLDFNDVAKGCLPAGVFSDDSHCDVLLCGYDAVSRNETGMAVQRAKEQGLLTVGLLDAWKGLQRFWHTDGQLREMTDYLLVPDAYIADWLVSHGLGNTRIEVIRHPKIEYFKSLTLLQREQYRQSAAMKLPVASNKTLMFFSEPVHENTNTGSPYQSLGDVKMCQRNTDTILRWIEEKYSASYELLIRQHPAESRQIPVGWHDASRLSLEESLFLPEKIIGVGSTMLMYAVAGGLDVSNISPLICWQPQQSDYDEEIWARLVQSGSLGHPRVSGFQNTGVSVVEKIQALI